MRLSNVSRAVEYPGSLLHHVTDIASTSWEWIHWLTKKPSLDVTSFARVTWPFSGEHRRACQNTIPLVMCLARFRGWVHSKPGISQATAIRIHLTFESRPAGDGRVFIHHLITLLSLHRSSFFFQSTSLSYHSLHSGYHGTALRTRSSSTFRDSFFFWDVGPITCGSLHVYACTYTTLVDP